MAGNGSEPPLKAARCSIKQVESKPYKWPFDGDFRPDNTALVVIDMQTDFCGKGGYVDTMGYDLSNTRAPIVPISILLGTLRERNFHIIHTREGHRPSLADCPDNKLWRSKQIGAGIGDAGPCGRILVRGEPGWDIIKELYPISGEEIVDKPGKGSFVATDIDMVLRQKGVRNLILAGITTDVCVNTTMREANDLGYECLLLSDCTGATDYGNHVAMMKTVQLEGGVFGCVATSADVLAALGAEVPASVSGTLEVRELGDGLSVRIPVRREGPGIPKSMEEAHVSLKAPPAGVDGRYAEADPYAWPYDGDLSPNNTVLLCVDFQNEFLASDGYLAGQGYDVGTLSATIAPTQRLMQAMRRKGFPIMYTREGYAPDLSDCPPRRREHGAVGQAGPLGRTLVRGETSWNITKDLEPQVGDIVFDKPCLGAFSVSAFEATLRSRGMRNVILTGLTADVRVHHTMRQGNDRGFECVLVSDCVASVVPDVYYSALKQVKMQHGVFGAVATSDALLKAIESLPNKE